MYCDEFAEDIFSKWQALIDFMSTMMSLPVGFVARESSSGCEILVASSNVDNPYSAGLIFDESIGVFCSKVVSAKLDLVSVANSDGWGSHSASVDSNFDTYIGYPILNPDKSVYGAICVFGRGATTIDKQCRELVKHFKSVIEFDLKLLEKLECATLLSLTDDLTGLHNRRGFNILSQQQYHIGKRSENFMAVAIIDIDGLKYINDNFGHYVGDEAIVLVAEALKCVSRKADLVSRIGGDEFLVAMPLNEKAEVDLVLHRLEEMLKGEQLKNGRAVSVSSGYHIKPFAELTSFDLRDFISNADDHLYYNKKASKSRSLHS